jgi:hypothetical protein
MPHNKHVIDGHHKELDEFGVKWFEDQVKDWKDPLAPATIVEHEGINVVRDDMIAGSKSRFADLLMSEIVEDTIVYVQPRTGLAGVSILDVAKRYNKKVVLFMPSSKRISQHQAVCIERGATPKFYRIAAMPNLNRIAASWAAENNAYFVPLGLKHPLVVAAAAEVARNIKDQVGREPEICFVATSTGVLVRGLQIGWPNTKFVSVAVSRNMHEGELGRADVVSEPLEFQTPEKIVNMPPYPTVGTYDAKAWKYAKYYKEQNPDKDVWIWNVGKEPELIDKDIFEKVDSQREWGEIRN